MDNFPVFSVAILTPLLAACLLYLPQFQRKIRAVSLLASGISFLLCLDISRRVMGSGPIAESWTSLIAGANHTLFSADALTAVPMALFAALTIVIISAAPQRDMNLKMAAAMLIILSSTLTAYAAENLIILLVGWTVNGIAFLAVGNRKTALPKVLLFLGFLCLAIGIGFMGRDGIKAGLAAPWSIADLRTLDAPGGGIAFFFLILAVLLHKGIIPAHTWVIASFDRGPLLHAGLLMNAHLGLFLMLRVIIPLLPQYSFDHAAFTSNIALITAAYTALIAISERQPRRLLALIALSQAYSILASVKSMNVEGTTGALLQWMVVATATTGLISIYRAIEARIGEDISISKFMGLASSMPRLAVFFAICGLALVGIPGTLGFIAEDLLLQGTLKSNPTIGILLPVATALNAIHIFRLFSRLFLGSKGPQVSIPDALPRERMVLAACVLFLILGGLVPQWFVNLRISASDATSAIESSVGADVD